jgi:hypothetical protein
VNTQTGTTYTAVLADADKVIEISNASANTVTIPPNSSVAFAIGTRIRVTQLGAGATTIVSGAGVTFQPASPAAMSPAGQYGTRTVRKRATDTWIVEP